MGVKKLDGIGYEMQFRYKTCERVHPKDLAGRLTKLTNKGWMIRDIFKTGFVYSIVAYRRVRVRL